MLAASWLDLVVGVDIHTHLVPTPAGPVPTPIPQPYVGLIGDPVGSVVAALTSAAISLVKTGKVDLPSGPVLINGFPAATTDESSKNTPVLRHLPMPPGMSHVKPPSGEATFPLGALKVTFGGANAVRMGEMALSCADPVPMPTSLVVKIPKGPPVMVSGPPSLDIENALASWAMGKLIRTTWKGVGRLAKYAGKLNPARRRNLVPAKKCTSAGHPVDVATGRVFTSAVDFTLPGPLPLVFERHYFSSWSHRDGVLGPGWSHSLDQAVWAEAGTVVHRNAEGQEIVFEVGEKAAGDVEREFFEPISRSTLVRERTGWRVVTAQGIVHHFARIDERGPFRIVRSTTRHPDVAITYGYDRDGHLREVVDCAGRVVRLEHEHGRLVRVLLPDPAQSDRWLPHVEFVHSPEGLLIEARDAHGQATRYQYDGRLMVEETNRNGVSFFWVYDGRGASARCLRTWGVSGQDVIFNQKLDYDPKNDATLVTDSYDAKTFYRMNPLGAIVEVIDPLGGKTAREYGDDLQVVSETDAAGNVTRHQYGPRGQLTGTTFPDGGQTIIKYDPRYPELIRLYQNEAGAVWRFQHDGHGQLIEVRGPEADAYHQYEWERGRLKKAQAAGGARTEVLERDRWGQPVLLRIPAGGAFRYEYDRRGRLVAVTSPHGGRQARGYDVMDRLVTVEEPDGNARRLVYDPEGNVLEASDRLSITRFTYTGWNKLATREEGIVAGQPGATIRFTWGAEGELRELRNERNHDHRFFYDPCLRLEREVAFDLQETRYRRNPAGWVTKVEKPHARVHTELKHDPRGRVLASVHSDGTWSRYVYRRDGALLEATNAAATVTFKRDALGRVLTESQGGELATSALLSSHYAGGQRTRLESSLGAGFDLARDAAGSPTGLSIALPDQGWVKTLSFEYDQAGLETRRQLPGGVVHEWQRDRSGRPTRQQVSGGADWSRDYRWSYDDRLTAIGDTRFGDTTYDHDSRGRLVAEHHGDRTLHRALDEVGNVYRHPDRSDRRYVRGGILRNDGDTSFAFDALGNMVERSVPGQGTWKYAWNGAGMLTQVARPDGAVIDYAYDALGRRVHKKVGDAETRWVWDGDVLLHELRPDTKVTWCHEPGSFTPLACIENDRSIRAVIPDHLGAPTSVYDHTGHSTWNARRDLYGVPSTLDTTLSPQWPGQHADPDTGLHYNRFRYYDPGLGEYISQDPIGLAGGINVYSYVPDPLVWIDPLGLSCLDGNSGLGSSATHEALVRALGARVRQSAGFADHGLPLILDENVMQRGLTQALRARGHNVRDIREIFGRTGVPDSEIVNVAKVIGGRVITNNVRDFGKAIAIPIPRTGGLTAEGVEQFIKYYTSLGP